MSVNEINFGEESKVRLASMRTESLAKYSASAQRLPN
jgi:hypothetical protein